MRARVWIYFFFLFFVTSSEKKKKYLASFSPSERGKWSGKSLVCCLRPTLVFSTGSLTLRERGKSRGRGSAVLSCSIFPSIACRPVIDGDTKRRVNGDNSSLSLFLFPIKKATMEDDPLVKTLRQAFVQTLSSNPVSLSFLLRKKKTEQGEEGKRENRHSFFFVSFRFVFFFFLLTSVLLCFPSQQHQQENIKQAEASLKLAANDPGYAIALLKVRENGERAEKQERHFFLSLSPSIESSSSARPHSDSVLKNKKNSSRSSSPPTPPSSSARPPPSPSRTTSSSIGSPRPTTPRTRRRRRTSPTATASPLLKLQLPAPRSRTRSSSRSRPRSSR